jgi:isoleucyl-tRNA synthetase
MKLVADAITNLDQAQIAELETNGEVNVTIINAGASTTYVIANTDLEIIAEDIPGWQVTNLGNLTVALDVTITEELKQEGLSRELINRVQNLRKELGFEVTDRITVSLQKDNLIEQAVAQHKAYICSEILAESLELTGTLHNANKIVIDDVELQISITKIN